MVAEKHQTQISCICDNDCG